MTQRNGWSGRRWLAIGVVLTLIPLIVIAGRGRRALIDGGEDEWKPIGDMALNLVDDHFSRDTGLPAPDNILLPMTLHIGNQTYDRLWINENGFVSLTQGATEPPTQTQLADAGSLPEIPGNVIAVFYADIVSRAPLEPCDEPRREKCSDITWAAVDMTQEEIDRFVPPPPPVTRGARVTWGDDNTGPSPEGVVVRGGAPDNDTKRGGFQIRLIDRSDLSKPARPGDFDLELNYNGIPWENVGIIGVKAGGVELDFSKFYPSFTGNNPAVDPRDDDPSFPCVDAGDVDPSFVPGVPFVCNHITVSFRNGVPNLRTYSADVSATVDAPASVSANAGESFSFDFTVRNVDYDDATTVTTRIDLLTGWSFVSATPGTVCMETGLQLTCNHGSLSSSGSRNVRLTLRSTQAGPSTPSVRVGADQFDPVPANNSASLAVAINPTADLSVTGCSAPASADRGATVSVNCTVRNDGPQIATDVVLTAQLNSVVTFQSGAGCSSSASTVTCQKGSIAANSTTDFSMTLNAVTAGSASISLSVAGEEHDPTQGIARGVTVSIAEPAVIKKGGGSGSLLMLVLLGLLPRRRYADPG